MITFKEAKRNFERRYVTTALMMTNGNVSQAARIAGKDRKDFYELMKRVEVSADTYRNG